MVNAEKHRRLLEESTINKLPKEHQALLRDPRFKKLVNDGVIDLNPLTKNGTQIGYDIFWPGKLEMGLREFFDMSSNTRKPSFGIYWGGINGALAQKINNWDYTKEEYFIRDGLRIAKSTNECMEGKTNYAYIGIRGNHLYYFTKEYLEKDFKELDVLYIDAPTYFKYQFDFFKIFEEVKDYDLVFIKDIDYGAYLLLMELGLNECINHVYAFIIKDDELIAHLKQQGINPEESGCRFIESANLSKKIGKTGFELYLHLNEWMNEGEVSPVTRNDSKYQQMKREVKKRDNYTCQCCGYRNTAKHNHGLEVHHIYGYKDHIDYRAEADNCVTLCKNCHKKYHSIYGKNATPITFSKFIRDFNQYYTAQTTLDSSMEKGVI